MLKYITSWIALKADRRAVTALEYGLIAGLIALVVVGALPTLNSSLIETFTVISSNLQ